MQVKTLKSLFEIHKETALFGRYVNGKSIAPLLKDLSKNFKIEQVGISVNRLPIHTIVFGKGKKKILMWSQMHGNESTTTKAIFDMLNVFYSNDLAVKHIFEQCTICIIPILNPDGAKMYTRLNANNMDLNRDAQDLTQPESLVLRKVFKEFKPDFCYNLHGQRTIFSAGRENKSATISFLAPAQDVDRKITKTRQKAMEVIVAMNENLQQQIPNQVGIYDDAFNLNCVGDTFQVENIPTILFEAGHYANDYDREVVREFIFQSLLVSLNYVATNTVTGLHHESYFNIPQNEKLFYDIIIRNAKGLDVAIQFIEKLEGDEVVFMPKIEKISNLSDFYAHREINANGYEVFSVGNAVLKVGDEIDFVAINNEKLMIKV
nr:M14 family zinc carboxypeptidase [uncultured Psychroserpens sp.]